MNSTITPRMRKGMEYILSHPSATNKEVAEFLGCHEQTVCSWKRHELYQEEFTKRLKEEWEDYRLEAQRKMKELSDSGDFNATKYILDSNGYQAPQQIEVNSNVIKVSIDEDE